MKKFGFISFVTLLSMIISLLNIAYPISAWATESNKESLTTDIKANKNISSTVNNTNTSKQPYFSDKTIHEYKYIYNLDDSADYIYIDFKNGGYVLFSAETMEMMEYSLQGALPYSSSSSKNYYAGPSNYLHKNNSTFINLLTNRQLDITVNEALNFAQQTRTCINSQTSYHLSSSKQKANNLEEKVNYFLKQNENGNTLNTIDTVPKMGDTLIHPIVGTGTLIPNYRYFSKTPTHGDNITGGSYGNGNSGTCGSVAAQILLGYNNYYNDRRIIEDKYLNGYDDSLNAVSDKEKNPNYCSDPMSMTKWTTGSRSEDTGTNSFYSKVVTTIMKPNTSGASVEEVCTGIKTILNENLSQNDYSANYELKGWFFGYSPVSSTPIKKEINAGRPLIISLSSNLGASDHQVVGYGYQDYTYPDGSGTYEGYVVHFGWQGETCVWVNSSWCKGYISLAIKHEHHYRTVGIISGTDRTEYKCRECGHRTDSAIIISAADRYIERTATIPQNGYGYKDYYITFDTAGNKLFQTFGSKDPLLFLYDVEYNQLAYSEDEGYKLNALFNYTVEANKAYILRVKFFSPSLRGDIKIGITPASIEYSNYDEIMPLKGFNTTYGFSSSLNTTRIVTFTPTESGIYTFKTSYLGDVIIDTCLYIVDPHSTNECLFNDDGAGNLQALISVDLIANRPYFIVVSTYNITSTQGRLELIIKKTT